MTQAKPLQRVSDTGQIFLRLPECNASQAAERAAEDRRIVAARPVVDDLAARLQKQGEKLRTAQLRAALDEAADKERAAWARPGKPPSDVTLHFSALGSEDVLATLSKEELAARAVQIAEAIRASPPVIEGETLPVQQALPDISPSYSVANNAKSENELTSAATTPLTAAEMSDDEAREALARMLAADVAANPVQSTPAPEPAPAPTMAEPAAVPRVPDSLRASPPRSTPWCVPYIVSSGEAVPK